MFVGMVGHFCAHPGATSAVCVVCRGCCIGASALVAIYEFRCARLSSVSWYLHQCPKPLPQGRLWPDMTSNCKHRNFVVAVKPDGNMSLIARPVNRRQLSAVVLAVPSSPHTAILIERNGFAAHVLSRRATKNFLDLVLLHSNLDFFESTQIDIGLPANQPDGCNDGTRQEENQGTQVEQALPHTSRIYHGIVPEECRRA
jgi:hypothetical protein